MDEARKQSGESQDALVFRGYPYLRALCEVGVESELLQGIVRRYEPNVRLTLLPQIKPEAMQTACKVIPPVYEETCRYIEAHSQPMEHLKCFERLTNWRGTSRPSPKRWTPTGARRDGYVQSLVEKGRVFNGNR